jgi:hypothetical protein
MHKQIRLKCIWKKVKNIYFDGKAASDGEVILDKEGTWWIGQCDSYFNGETCWDDKCKNNQCCNKAAKQIVSTAGATVGERIIIAQTNHSCADAKGTTIKYYDNGLTFNEKAFDEAVQVIDISLKEHKLPIMIGVQHPYWKDDKWYYKCGPASNNPRATNHFIVIVGKGYDKAKKMNFYYFYEVSTSNKANGTSRMNKLWVDTNQYTIKGNVSTKEKDDYYIVTDVRRNSNKIYNLKNNE